MREDGGSDWINIVVLYYSHCVVARASMLELSW